MGSAWEMEGRVSKHVRIRWWWAWIISIFLKRKVTKPLWLMIYDLTSLKIQVWARSPLISYDSIFLTLWIKNGKSSCEQKEYQKDSRVRGNCLLPLLSPKINFNHSSLSHPLHACQVHPTVTTAFALWPSANNAQNAFLNC